MRNKFNIYTDLAVENKERFQGDNVEISGVKVYEKYDNKYLVNLTKVEIVSPEGANIMGKPIGKYVTIDALDIRENNAPLTDFIDKDVYNLLNIIFNNALLNVGKKSKGTGIFYGVNDKYTIPGGG